MKRAKRLGTAIFAINTLHIEQEYEPNTFLASTRKSAAGSNIEYFAADHSPELTLVSNSYSLLTDENREKVIAMYNDPIDYEIQYSDDTTEMVSFRLDLPPRFDEYGVGSCLYTTKINLTKKVL